MEIETKSVGICRNVGLILSNVGDIVCTPVIASGCRHFRPLPLLLLRSVTIWFDNNFPLDSFAIAVPMTDVYLY